MIKIVSNVSQLKLTIVEYHLKIGILIANYVIIIQVNASSVLMMLDQERHTLLIQMVIAMKNYALQTVIVVNIMLRRCN